MKPIKAACFVMTISALLTAGTFLFLPRMAQAASGAPLTPDQVGMVAEKNAQRKAAGVPDYASEIGQVSAQFAKANPPVTFSNRKVKINKNETRERLLRAKATDQAGILASRQLTGPQKPSEEQITQLLNDLEKDYAEQERRVEALPEGDSEIELPSIEIGAHSVSVTGFTYNTAGAASDPLNASFYRVGSAWDVDFDLKHWTSYRYEDTGLGASQMLYIWDASHVGGWDAWRTVQNYQMQPQGSFICPRDHVRLFQGFVRDSHTSVPFPVGGYGWWTMAAVHHDSCPVHYVDDWEGPEGRLVNAFRDSGGTLLWFVQQQWCIQIGNAGTFQGANNDGYACATELKQ